jgi:hypothetical protein
LALKAVQLLTPIFALLQMLVVLKLIRRLFPNLHERFPYCIAWVTLLPMQIYTSAFISNEVFSSLMISVALFILVVMVSGLRFGIGYSAALGIMIALACLSKYTGFLMAMTAGFVYAVLFAKKWIQRRQWLISFLTASLLFIAIAGPYYFRNIEKYGKPMPDNIEFRKQPRSQYFDLAFFADPLRVGLGVVDKYRSRMSSFIDGTYSSMWLDNTHQPYPWTMVLETLIYYLAVFPTFLVAAGFFRAIAGCRSDSEIGRAYLPILAMFIFALFAYLYFILRFGGSEAVKAFYLLSQIAPLGIFFVIGCGYGIGRGYQKRLFAAPMKLLYSAILLYYLLAPWLIGKGL